MRLAAIAVLALLPYAPCGAAPPAPEEVERAALAARSQIRTAYVAFSVTTLVNTPGLTAEHRSERKTWLDGKRIRAEYLHRKGPDEGVRYLECVHCEKDGWGIAASDARGRATVFLPLDTPNAAPLRDAIDPRNLGYYPTIYVTLQRFPFNSLFGAGGRSPPTITEEELDGTRCWVLRWDTTYKTSVAVWVAPLKGHNVARIEALDRSAEPVRRLVVSSDLSPAGPAGLWFPSRVSFRETRSDVTVHDETVDVQEVRLNEAIPTELFTLAGTQLRPTPYVISPTPEQSGFLQDGKIDPTPQNGPRRAPLITTEEKQRPNYWLLGTAAVLAAVAVAVAVVRRRQRPA